MEWHPREGKSKTEIIDHAIDRYMIRRETIIDSLAMEGSVHDLPRDPYGRFTSRWSVHGENYTIHVFFNEGYFAHRIEWSADAENELDIDVE